MNPDQVAPLQEQFPLKGNASQDARLAQHRGQDFRRRDYCLVTRSFKTDNALGILECSNDDRIRLYILHEDDAKTTEMLFDVGRSDIKKAYFTGEILSVFVSFAKGYEITFNLNGSTRDRVMVGIFGISGHEFFEQTSDGVYWWEEYFRSGDTKTQNSGKVFWRIVGTSIAMGVSFIVGTSF